MDNLNVKNLVYELKPVAVAAMGLYTMSIQSIGPVGKLAGLILLGCGIAIVYMRARYRGLIR